MGVEDAVIRISSLVSGIHLHIFVFKHDVHIFQEAMTCFTDLHSPSLHHLFILTSVEHTYDMKPRARHDTGRLFAELLLREKLSKEQVTAG